MSCELPAARRKQFITELTKPEPMLPGKLCTIYVRCAGDPATRPAERVEAKAEAPKPAETAPAKPVQSSPAQQTAPAAPQPTE